jgi:hypothetical protein
VLALAWGIAPSPRSVLTPLAGRPAALDVALRPRLNGRRDGERARDRAPARHDRRGRAGRRLDAVDELPSREPATATAPWPRRLAIPPLVRRAAGLALGRETAALSDVSLAAPLAALPMARRVLAHLGPHRRRFAAGPGADARRRPCSTC